MMLLLTLGWITLPLFVGFSIYLLPQLARVLAIAVSLISLFYGLWHVLYPEPVALSLVDSFGVSLLVDQLSGFFVLTNSVVTAAVVLYCWQSGKSAFFYTQAIILHGSMNSVFICADLISVYVALEVIGIAAFLLIAYPRTDRAVWVGLRYLFVSNTAMLFYLLGAALVYQANRSFAFTALSGAPVEAIALIFLGLLSKGGIFVSGMWLPPTHGESESPVSALLSGVVVKAGIFPLLRFSLMMPEFDPVVRFFGVATALFGVSFAVFARDTKRLLAFSTVSQLGFILAAPVVGGFYALTHGLAKAALFLIAGKLPSREIEVLKKEPMPTSLWVVLATASLSISGLPLLSGFSAKVLTSNNLLDWQSTGLNVAALGTATLFAKFVFLPHSRDKFKQFGSKPFGAKQDKHKQSNSIGFSFRLSGFGLAMALLLGGLVLANAFYYEAYTLKYIIKPLVILGLGWLAHWLLFQRLSVKLPRVAEQFDHLIGVMSLVLTFLFWMVMA